MATNKDTIVTQSTAKASAKKPVMDAKLEALAQKTVVAEKKETAEQKTTEPAAKTSAAKKDTAAAKKETAAKETTKKTTKKETATKTAAKKDVKVNVTVEYKEGKVSQAEIIKKVNAKLKEMGVAQTSVRRLELYVQPENNKVYFVVNSGTKKEICDECECLFN